MKIKNFFKTIGGFLKRNAYYVILFVCISGIAAMITLASINSNPEIEQQIIDNSGNENNDIGGNDAGENVNTEPVLLISPVENFEEGMSFTENPILQTTLKDIRTHKALDYKTEGSAEVKACFDGVVESVYKNSREGNVIVIKHNDELSSIYKSLSDDIQVEIGNQIKKGDCIGYTSNTMGDEYLEGNHLHLEVKYQGKLVNPLNFMEEGSK